MARAQSSDFTRCPDCGKRQIIIREVPQEGPVAVCRTQGCTFTFWLLSGWTLPGDTPDMRRWLKANADILSALVVQVRTLVNLAETVGPP